MRGVYACVEGACAQAWTAGRVERPSLVIGGPRTSANGRGRKREVQAARAGSKQEGAAASAHGAAGLQLLLSVAVLRLQVRQDPRVRCRIVTQPAEGRYRQRGVGQSCKVPVGLEAGWLRSALQSAIFATPSPPGWRQGTPVPRAFLRIEDLRCGRYVLSPGLTSGTGPPRCGRAGSRAHEAAAVRLEPGQERRLAARQGARQTPLAPSWPGPPNLCSGSAAASCW